MELRAINVFDLGDRDTLVRGEIWKVSSMKGSNIELECICGINIGMFMEFSREQIANLFEVCC